MKKDQCIYSYHKTHCDDLKYCDKKGRLVRWNIEKPSRDNPDWFIEVTIIKCKYYPNRIKQIIQKKI